MDPLRICMVSAEVTPFAKTGGLADVAAALSRQLAKSGHDVRLFLPLYRRIREGEYELTPDPRLQDVPVRFGERTLHFSISRTRLPNSALDLHLVRCPELYDRAGIYTSDGDEHVRFALLSRAALECCQYDQWAPQVVHCHDWHAALTPLYLKTLYAWDRLFEGTKTALTIHNLGYQGVFGEEELERLGLENERQYFWQEDLAQGFFGFLKTGLVHADVLTTVSHTYAREIQTPEHGMGLHELLARRSDHLVGIVNGIDADEWNPSADPHIAAHYDVDDARGKLKDRAALLQAFELQPDPGGPVLGAVSRLTGQKGFELLPDVLPVVLQREDVRLVVLGSGEERYETYFQWLRDTYPNKVAYFRGYDEALSHRVEAGADVFLMPSRYEPCGLNQMYSLRYGTVPIVRRTGGLADTVEPWDAAAGTGTGFLFDEFTAEAFQGALRAALEAWRDRRGWSRLVRNGMSKDYSWERQAQEYVRLYELLLRG